MKKFLQLVYFGFLNYLQRFMYCKILYKKIDLKANLKYFTIMY